MQILFRLLLSIVAFSVIALSGLNAANKSGHQPQLTQYFATLPFRENAVFVVERHPPDFRRRSQNAKALQI